MHLLKTVVLFHKKITNSSPNSHKVFPLGPWVQVCPFTTLLNLQKRFSRPPNVLTFQVPFSHIITKERNVAIHLLIILLSY